MSVSRPTLPIPPDMYEVVLDLAHALIEPRSRKAGWRDYNALRTYCEGERDRGRDHDHPFLWETLGDFTPDDVAALGIYGKALELARAADAKDYVASILLTLARRHHDLGERDVARDFATESRSCARELDDAELLREVEELIVELG